MLHSILLLLASALIGYLFGSIPNAALIGKVFYHKDVREYGSKNAGGTNAGRVLGKKVGFIVIVLDLIKTIVPIYLCYCLLEYTPLSEYGLSEYGYIVAAFFALIGHCFPVFAGFKGGKAVSSFAAICLATNWLISLIGFLFFMAVLKWKKYVSLASISASLLVTLLALINIFVPGNPGTYLFPNSPAYFLLILVSSAILIVRHRSNIVRLMHHEERKITWMK